MGCSPSKGNNFVTMNAHRRNRMLPSQPRDQQKDFVPGEGNHSGVKPADVHIQENHMPEKTQQREAQKTTEISSEKAVSQKTSGASLPQRRETHVDKQEATEKKSGRRTKKNTKGAKGGKRKDKDKVVDQKVDFPDELVRAHQAAYAFLNPNIDKYNAVLELLEQATQTQESVQPMVAFMALSYEQTILVLEEIADEGENVLKEYGDFLAWPRKNPPASSKSSSCSEQPPPDLLQQLLQYTTQRMRNVIQTIRGLGDSALEEAVEYFSSVAELLEEKLKVKKTAEIRLMQLLSRIELASLRKPGPEDCALFSEDSGIGGESESVAGSEKRLCRESCGSTGTRRTNPICPKGLTSMSTRKRIQQQISPSDSLSSLNSLGLTGTVMFNENKEPFLASVYLSNESDHSTIMEEGPKNVRVRFNKQSPLLNRETQQPRCIASRHIENSKNVEMKNAISEKMNFVTPSSFSAKKAVTGSPKCTIRQWSDEKGTIPKRPQTVAPVRRAVVKTPPKAIERRSRSAESIRSKSEDPTLLELERTQKTLNQRLQKINKGKEVSNKKNELSRQKKGTQSPKMNPKRQTSQKSCQTSTQDQEGLTQTHFQEQESTTDKEENCEEGKKKIPFIIRATPPPSPPMSPKPSTGFHRGRNSVKRLIDSLSQEIEDHDNANIMGPLKGVRKCGVPVLPGLGNVEAALSVKNSAKLESSLSVDLDSLPPPPLEVLMDNSFESAEHLIGGEEEDVRSAKSPVVKRAAMSKLRTSVQSVLPSKGSFPQGLKGLSRTSQRVIPCNLTASESESQTEKSVNYSEDCSSTMKENLQGACKPSVSGHNATYSGATSQTPSTGPRGRMLPSTPSTPSTSNRRLPSPQTFNRQPTPPSSASPPVYGRLPSPNEIRKVHTSPSTSQKFSNTFSSYSFKAPSPPASPKVQRRKSSTEDAAHSFNNARSVFCPASPTMFETLPCPRPPQAWTCSRVSVLSKAWEGRGRFPVSVPGPRPFLRRSHSDRRPSLTLPSRSRKVSVAETCGSEPSISTQGLDDVPSTEDELWGSQSDLSFSSRSASHPDLCVVGHAFYRD